MKKIILLLITASFLASCSDFLNTAPNDAISSETFWKTEDDARKAVVGCYNDFASGYQILYLDCTSDIAYCPFTWEGGYTQVANGTMSASSCLSLYGYTAIRRCNTFLANIDKIAFKDPAEKSYMIAQVRVIRAYKYALMNQWYGGVPLSNELAETAAEAQLPRKTQQEIYDFVVKEIDAALADLKATDDKGRITKGTALALKMRTALHLNDYATALNAAQEVQKLGYTLEPKYENLFALTGKDSKEIIYATQYLMVVQEFWLTGAMYNQMDNGWSSITPSHNLVDMYEMANGQTITEAGSGYDAVHPYAGRDPRFYASILYSGKDWKATKSQRIFNTLDKDIDGKKNDDAPANGDGTRTGLTWGKYLFPGDQYKDPWKTDACPILYRYAEVLLTIAECNVEMDNGSLAVAADCLDEIRLRAGMPAVDRAKYSSKEAMRELVRRERTIELAGEGLRRQDILRWTDSRGQMVAQTVMPGALTRVTGTVDYTVTDETKRAKIAVGKTEVVENRVFDPYMKFLPFPQAELDKNKQLKQNAGY